MICGFCGFENEDWVKFCGNCGTRLKIICQNCGKLNPINYNFCGECGIRLKEKGFERVELGGEGTSEGGRIEVREEGREGELRTVSVLFADISGFTSLSEKLDAEELQSFISKILNELADIAKKNGGHVDKFIGDEIMVLFGAPVAYGNDTLRAVRSALEMMEYIRKNYELSLHCGIATGDVVVGSISGSSKDYTAMGDTVNTAKRLEEVSQSWEILVDENTYILTKDEFDYKEIEKKLQGKEKKIRVFQLLSTKKAKRGFVGRRKEREKALGVIRRYPGFLLVCGEHGVGVSSFIESLLDGFPFSKITPLKSPFGIVRDMLKGLVVSPDDILKVSRTFDVDKHILAYIFGIIYEDSPIPYMKPLDIVSFVAESVARIISKAFIDMVFVIDNVDAADDLSIDVLSIMPEKVDSGALFSILLGGSLHLKDKFTKWEKIVLGNLTKEETEEFIKEYINSTPDSTFVELIYSKTEGNPFFIREVLDYLMSSNSIVFDGKAKVKEFDIPKTFGIKQFIMSKVDALPQNAKEVLQIISCLQSSPLEVPLRYFGRDINYELEVLKNLGFISISDNIVSINSVLIRDVVYESILKKKRMKIHQDIFKILDNMGEELNILYMKGEQAEKSEDFKKAYYSYIKGVERAEEKFDIKTAVSFLEKIMGFIDKIDKADGTKAIMKYGKLLYRLGEMEKALEVFDYGFRYSDDLLQKIEFLRWKGDVIQTFGKFDEAEKVYNEAIYMIEDLEKQRGEVGKKEKEEKQKDWGVFEKLKGEIFSLMCHLNVERGRPSDGIDFGLKAVNIGLSLDDMHLLSDSYNALGRSYFALGNLQKAREFFEKFYEISKKIDDLRIRGVATSNYGAVLFHMGECDTALRMFMEHLSISRKIQDMKGEGVALANISISLYETGKVNLSFSKFEEALKVLAKTKDKYAILETLGHYAFYLFLEGNFSRALEIADELQKEGEEKRARIIKYLIGIEVGKFPTEKELEEVEIDDPKYYLLLGRFYGAKGEFALGLEYSKRAYELAVYLSERDFSIAVYALNLSIFEPYYRSIALEKLKKLGNLDFAEGSKISKLNYFVN